MAVVIPMQYNGFSSSEGNQEGDASVVSASMTSPDKLDNDNASTSSSCSNSFVMVPANDDDPIDTIVEQHDNSEMSLSLDITEETELEGVSSANNRPSYGGLSNLGNTCYMASALQMLASLDGFVSDLRTKELPALDEDDNGSAEDGSDGESSKSSKQMQLRDALLDVLGRLQKGETVRPEVFKQCIDERTGLFLGYRQQDSHEFLTTLLDLIDEDYKRKAESDEESSNSSDADQEMDDVEQPLLSTSQDSNEGSHDEESHDEESHDSQEYADEAGRVDEDMQQDPMVSEVPSGIGVERTPSFKNLNFGDIEDLLHGDKPIDSSETSCSNVEQTEPKCKLIGGRMSTSHADLTRYEQHNDYELGATSANQEYANKSPEEEDDSNSEIAVVSESPVDSHFKTEVRVCLTCESCKYRRSHTETYLHLSLEIGSGCCSSVEDGLRRFFAPEKREVKCEKCFHNSAVQTMEITKLPKALLFHLKRFIVDISPDYTSVSYRKDRSAVAFDERIALEDDGEGLFEEFLATDVTIQKGSSYAIRSVVNHIGSSASCGHYTADAKRWYRNEAGGQAREWTRFNDSYVSRISPSCINNETAYMIMYELEE